MSMNLEKQTFSTAPDYLIAGPAEITTAVKTTAAALKRGAPVVLDASGKLAAITVADGTVTTTGLYGIMAEDAASGEDVELGENESATEIALRNLGIFLK